jgi:hypothetical protein
VDVLVTLVPGAIAPVVVQLRLASTVSAVSSGCDEGRPVAGELCGS